MSRVGDKTQDLIADEDWRRKSYIRKMRWTAAIRIVWHDKDVPRFIDPLGNLLKIAAPVISNELRWMGMLIPLGTERRPFESMMAVEQS